MYADPDNSLVPHRTLWIRCHCYFDFLDEEPPCLDGKSGWMDHASQVPVNNDCSHLGTSVLARSHRFNISAASAGIKVPCEAWFWKQFSSFLGIGFRCNPHPGSQQSSETLLPFAANLSLRPLTIGRMCYFFSISGQCKFPLPDSATSC